jgi:hypothetical protein
MIINGKLRKKPKERDGDPVYTEQQDSLNIRKTFRGIFTMGYRIDESRKVEEILPAGGRRGCCSRCRKGDSGHDDNNANMNRQGTAQTE